MKRMLDQKTIDELQKLIDNNGVEWVNSIKRAILFDSSVSTINFNNKVYTDLPIILDGGLELLKDGSEIPLFPLENNAGKILAVNEDEDGLVAVDRLPPIETIDDVETSTDYTYTKNFVKNTLNNTSSNPIAITFTNDIEMIFYVDGDNNLYIQNGHSTYVSGENEFAIKSCGYIAMIITL